MIHLLAIVGLVLIAIILVIFIVIKFFKWIGNFTGFQLGCGIVVIGVMILIVPFLFLGDKKERQFYLDATDVYSEPIEKGEPLAEIFGIAQIVGSPQEEKGGWTFVELQGFSGWVQSAKLSHLSFGRLGNENDVVAWKGKNVRVEKTPGGIAEAVSGGFLLQFGDGLFPYAKTSERLYYYSPGNYPLSFKLSSYASAPVTELDDGRTISLSDNGEQYLSNDCGFYYLNTSSGQLSAAGTLPAGTRVLLGEPHFPFAGRSSELRILMDDFPSKSENPCVVKMSEVAATSTKPGISPPPIRWNE